MINTSHHCRRPAVTSMDYIKEGERFINRMCLTCKKHWFGWEQAVKEFTGPEWEAFIADDCPRQQ